jgi:hypothetical protein
MRPARCCSAIQTMTLGCRRDQQERLLRSRNQNALQTWACSCAVPVVFEKHQQSIHLSSNSGSLLCYWAERSSRMRLEQNVIGALAGPANASQNSNVRRGREASRGGNNRDGHRSASLSRQGAAGSNGRLYEAHGQNSCVSWCVGKSLHKSASLLTAIVA